MKHLFITFLFSFGPIMALGQSWSLHGQASGWIISHPNNSWDSHAGARYIPEFTMEQTLQSTLNVEIDLSLNAYTAIGFVKNKRPEYESKSALYRAWIRLTTDEWEIRIGLQKINFGSATLFRPLMWFDRIDPRDPLQLTDGVYGVLVRYYFLDNTNVWLWGLYGNDGTKGWETIPTKKKTFEYGGRVQTSVWTGEAGFSFHHRTSENNTLIALSMPTGDSSIPENRYALDGKWDVGIGVWFEATLTNTQTEILNTKYKRQWMVGTDYTFVVGNGLTVLTEFFRYENPETPFGSTMGHEFAALSLTYPVGLLDRFSCILYRDWTNREWYRLLTWQRTYDNWILYLLGFWNPQYIQLYHIHGGSNPFAGNGIQLMVVFNH